MTMHTGPTTSAIDFTTMHTGPTTSAIDFTTNEPRYRKQEGSLLLLLLKEVGQCKAKESDIHPISPKTPAPQYQAIDRKERKGKRVEDYSWDRAA